MRLVILHPTIPDDATLEDQDSLVQVEAISQALRRLGHEPVAMGCTLDLDAVRRDLIEAQPEVVFNLVESLLGTDRLQYMAAGLLDALGWPYTGAPTEAIFQTTHKLLAKQLLHMAGLPTPAWLARCEAGDGDAGDGAAEFAWEGPPLCPDTPCIIKAVWEHASRGLDDENIVAAADLDRLPDRLRQQSMTSGQPWFAEQFIEGREFNLSLLGGDAGPEVLPCAEIDFSAFPPEKPRIVGHRAGRRRNRSGRGRPARRRRPERQVELPPLDELLRRTRAARSSSLLAEPVRQAVQISGAHYVLVVQAAGAVFPNGLDDAGRVGAKRRPSPGKFRRSVAGIPVAGLAAGKPGRGRQPGHVQQLLGQQLLRGLEDGLRPCSGIGPAQGVEQPRRHVLKAMGPQQRFHQVEDHLGLRPGSGRRAPRRGPTCSPSPQARAPDAAGPGKSPPPGPANPGPPAWRRRGWWGAG